MAMLFQEPQPHQQNHSQVLERRKHGHTRALKIGVYRRTKATQWTIADGLGIILKDGSVIPSQF